MALWKPELGGISCSQHRSRKEEEDGQMEVKEEGWGGMELEEKTQVEEEVEVS